MHDISLADLGQMVQRKCTEAEQLLEQVSQMEKQLGQMKIKLTKLVGNELRSNGVSKTLKEVATEALLNGPRTARHIASVATSMGFYTKAKTLNEITQQVYNALRDRRFECIPGTKPRQYRLKKSK